MLTVPNVLSLGRMVLAPGIAYLILYSHWDGALLAFLLAGATDALDGFIAKHFNQEVGGHADNDFYRGTPKLTHPRGHDSPTIPLLSCLLSRLLS